jgi:hypothetical protein
MLFVCGEVSHNTTVWRRSEEQLAAAPHRCINFAGAIRFESYNRPVLEVPMKLTKGYGAFTATTEKAKVEPPTLLGSEI